MASQGANSANSRLTQMQMRFQQKQQQEREQRRIEMSSNGDDASVGQKPNANGKVRQMFDERRRGVDRSHPLKPITTSTSSTMRSSQSNQSISSIRASQPATRRAPAVAAVGAQRRTMNNNNSREVAGARSHPRDPIDQHDNGNGSSFAKQFSSMSLNESRYTASSGDYNGNDTNAGIKLNPVVTKKSPQVTAQRATAPARQTTPKVGSVGRSTRSGVGAAPTKTAATVRSPPKSANKLMAVKNTAPQAGMATCRYCGRHFLEDRLNKHEVVCQKVQNSKRKVFDASKHRVKGTEAEQFVRKPPARSAPRTNVSNPGYGGSQPAANSGADKKNNWRKKHEEFIAAIRAAKQVQAHIARGGKLSDLPPPTPSENPDYIQCPHCLRRFNETAAERHIPKCATMLHNKPKPGQPPRR